MTAADRQQIRAAIDAHQRARRQHLVDAGDLIVCRTCGCDSDTTTAGCKACSDRHRKHARRQDPVFRQAETIRTRELRRQNGLNKRKVPSSFRATINL